MSRAARPTLETADPRAQAGGPRVILVMGVSGVGKTEIGRQLAARLGWAFLDADEDHPAGNVSKMSAGFPLTDADRAPWLTAVRARLLEYLEKGASVVLACSALKQAYRTYLADIDVRLTIVHLAAPESVVRRRLTRRDGHFMKADLLDTQFAALEPPEHALVVDAAAPIDEVVTSIHERLRLSTSKEELRVARARRSTRTQR